MKLEELNKHSTIHWPIGGYDIGDIEIVDGGKLFRPRYEFRAGFEKATAALKNLGRALRDDQRTKGIGMGQLMRWNGIRWIEVHRQAEINAKQCRKPFDFWAFIGGDGLSAVALVVIVILGVTL